MSSRLLVVSRRRTLLSAAAAAACLCLTHNPRTVSSLLVPASSSSWSTTNHPPNRHHPWNIPKPATNHYLQMSSSAQDNNERKAGVASPEELRVFVQEAGDKLVVIDVRNPDASVEPGDQKSLQVAGLPGNDYRPQALHLIYDRSAKQMPVPDIPKDTPIITHCGGGGRGQKAKDYLLAQGFTNVLNGGGPKETDCWAEFGDK